MDSEAQALALVARLRAEGRQARASGGAEGLDVASVESIDRRCLELLREDGSAPAGLIGAGADTALLFELERFLMRGQHGYHLALLGPRPGARVRAEVTTAAVFDGAFRFGIETGDVMRPAPD